MAGVGILTLDQALAISFSRTKAGGHPGGFCFLRDPPNRLAVHPGHARNLALRLAHLQQRLD